MVCTGFSAIFYLILCFSVGNLFVVFAIRKCLAVIKTREEPVSSDPSLVVKVRMLLISNPISGRCSQGAHSC